MKVAIVSTYPPRPCGIAMFSADLRAALLAADCSVEVDVISIVADSSAGTRAEVRHVIRQEVIGDYAAAAARLNRSRPDVVMIEHEFGIFGGETGQAVLTLVDGLTVPVVVTLHTVLERPSSRQAGTLRSLCDRAVRVQVFTETARRMIIEQGLADPERVRVVPHGAPEILYAAGDRESARGSALRGVVPLVGTEIRPSQTVLSSFGLISASKGLEVAIRALPTIVAAHPDVVYLVAGQTHPEVRRHEGERYRLELEQLVRALDLERHVAFVDRFLTVEELATLLHRTDVYLTPYRSREQIVSGALTFAVAGGCPVVSTPYFYAEDLLASGAGVLVPFGDPDAIAAAVVALLDSPAELAAAGAEARRIGARMTWSSVARATLDVLSEASVLVRRRAWQPTVA